MLSRKDGSTPAEAKLKCTVPQIYSGLPAAEIGRALARRVAELVLGDTRR